MDDGQIGYHKVFDMTAPRDYAYFELISERPSYLFSYYINGRRWETTDSLVQHGRGCLDFVVHYYLPYVAHRTGHSFPAF
jgi:hypothetical protein